MTTGAKENEMDRMSGKDLNQIGFKLEGRTSRQQKKTGKQQKTERHWSFGVNGWTQVKDNKLTLPDLTITSSAQVKVKCPNE